MWRRTNVPLRAWMGTSAVRTASPIGSENNKRVKSLHDVLSELHCPAPLHDRASIISRSKNVFVNLTTEEAILRAAFVKPISEGGDNHALKMLLFSYIDEPCVVMGRNQLPFMEVDVPYCHSSGVALARRHSGGGTVAHDEGNVNFSFFTHRKSYDPARTISILKRFLVRTYGVDSSRLTTTKRNDIFLDGKKISGSAMRLQRDIAYHHCTLLVNSDTSNLSKCLKRVTNLTFLESHATESVRSPITTLHASGVTSSPPTQVQTDFAKYFMKHCFEDYAACVVTPVSPDQPTIFSVSWTPSETKSEPDELLPTISEVALPDNPLDAAWGSTMFVLAKPPTAANSGNTTTLLREECNLLMRPQWVFGAGPPVKTKCLVSLPQDSPFWKAFHFEYARRGRCESSTNMSLEFATSVNNGIVVDLTVNAISDDRPGIVVRWLSDYLLSLAKDELVGPTLVDRLCRNIAADTVLDEIRYCCGACDSGDEDGGADTLHRILAMRDTLHVASLVSPPAAGAAVDEIDEGKEIALGLHATVTEWCCKNGWSS